MSNSPAGSKRLSASLSFFTPSTTTGCVPESQIPSRGTRSSSCGKSHDTSGDEAVIGLDHWRPSEQGANVDTSEPKAPLAERAELSRRPAGHQPDRDIGTAVEIGDPPDPRILSASTHAHPSARVEGRQRVAAEEEIPEWPALPPTAFLTLARHSMASARDRDRSLVPGVTRSATSLMTTESHAIVSAKFFTSRNKQTATAPRTTPMMQAGSSPVFPFAYVLVASAMNRASTPCSSHHGPASSRSSAVLIPGCSRRRS
jgi:hypothetical protein